MDTSTLLMLLAGGFLAYKFLGTTSSVAASSGTTNTTNATQQNTIDTQMALNTLNQVAQLMQQGGDSPNGYHSVDVYNYYYKTVRGVNGPDAATLFPNNDPAKLYGIMEWWNAMTGQGFSGMGSIARHVNPYKNPVQGLYFGSNIRPNVSETMIVKRPD